jgi:hypothetical protein
MAVQAKFYVSEVTREGYGPGSTGADGKPLVVRPKRKVKLQATSRKDESSRKFWEATPYGTIELGLSAVDGDAAGIWFEERLGKSVILTFEDADD